MRRSRLQTVINATGIIIHTNLGRAPVASEAAESVARIAASYTNLEQDLTTGTRGVRARYLEHAIAVACGSAAATVVNNCAAALVLIVHDLGSGAMFDTRTEGLQEHEPTAAEAIKEGADLVCFSGDKLFGGPQAGIIVGRKRWIDVLKKEPLFRALRCDKLVLAGLQTTVDLHLTASETNLPVRSLLRVTKDELRARAAAMLVRLRGLP